MCKSSNLKIEHKNIWLTFSDGLYNDSASVMLKIHFWDNENNIK